MTKEEEQIKQHAEDLMKLLEQYPNNGIYAHLLVELERLLSLQQFQNWKSKKLDKMPNVSYT